MSASFARAAAKERERERERSLRTVTAGDVRWARSMIDSDVSRRVSHGEDQLYRIQ